MRSLKTGLPLLLIVALLAPPTLAQDSQSAQAANTIKGKLDIKYNSRTRTTDNGQPEEGVADQYTFDMTVVDTLLFQGTVEHLPTILSAVLGREQQSAKLTYNMNLAVRNPKNLSQTRNIGKLVGGVPIDAKGVYHFDKGTLRMAVDAAGQAAGFESAFRGKSAGKPPVNDSTLGRAKKKALTLTRTVKGKTVSIVTTDYDVMNYSGLILAAGPVKAYPETQVSGEMLYDYERDAWYFRNVTMTYQGPDGKAVTDKLSGNIKWVESPQRASNGEGQYEFDVRVNEPEKKAGEGEVFEKVDDEESFFTVDTSIPSLTGTAKYKDTMRGEDVTASAIAIDLAGNGLTKQQVVNLAKLLWWVNVVPMNAE